MIENVKRLLQKNEVRLHNEDEFYIFKKEDLFLHGKLKKSFVSVKKHKGNIICVKVYF